MKPSKTATPPPEQKKPHNGSAYSDRTAYILAGMSMLAYERFDKEREQDKKITIKSILSVLNSKKVGINLSNVQEATPKELRKIVNSLDKEVLANALSTKSNGKKEIQHNLNEIGWNLKETISVSNNICNTQVIITQKENQVVLAFRGTDKTKFKDIISDLKSTKKQAKKGKDLSGSFFHNVYQEAKHDITTALHNTIGENKNIKLFVTGHSLGGALAAIATRDIELHTSFSKNLEACYTYGCPRYDTDEFMSGLETQIYRVVNNNDIVTKFPLFGGYTHYGNPYFLSNTHQEGHADIKMTNQQNIWKRILLLEKIIKGCIGLTSFISDHSIYNYYEKLKAYAIIRNRRIP